MKIAELFTGLKYMMNNEQSELVKMLKEKPLIRTELNERFQDLAEQMTCLGLIDRIYDEEKQVVEYKLFQK